MSDTPAKNFILTNSIDWPLWLSFVEGRANMPTYLYLKALLLFHHQSIRDPAVLLSESYKKPGTGLTRRNPFLPAAFADDIETRHSTQGYSFRLFNGLMNWKASKQRTVTINSTEAELLGVSSACRNYYGGTDSSSPPSWPCLIPPKFNAIIPKPFDYLPPKRVNSPPSFVMLMCIDTG